MQVLPAALREMLLGFPKDNTLCCLPSAERRMNPRKWEDVRCSLIGNTFHVPTIAWLLACFFVQEGVLERMPTVAELTDPRLPYDANANFPPRGLRLGTTWGCRVTAEETSASWGDPLA